MKKPFFSIIIRTTIRNRKQFLLRSVLSVIEQSQSEFSIEIIIINDSSIDLDRDILSKLKEIKTNNITYKFVKNSNEHGRSIAANLGLRAASGECIGFLDDDDYFLSNHLMEHYKIYKNNSDAKFTISLGKEIFERIYHDKISTIKELEKKITNFNKYSLFLFENFFPFNSLVFKKAVLKKTGIFDSNLNVLEDWDFIIRLFVYYEPVFIKKITCCYSTRFGSSNVRMGFENRAEWRDSYKYVIKKYNDYFKKNDIIVPISEIYEASSEYLIEWNNSHREIEQFKDSYIYKIYSSNFYLLLKKFLRIFKITRG